MALISCRLCGKPCAKGNAGLCVSCRNAQRMHSYGAADYRANAAAMRKSYKIAVKRGNTYICALCKHVMRPSDPISIDHIMRVRDGGTNEMTNLQVVHAVCNSRYH